MFCNDFFDLHEQGVFKFDVRDGGALYSYRSLIYPIAEFITYTHLLGRYQYEEVSFGCDSSFNVNCMW